MAEFRVSGVLAALVCAALLAWTATSQASGAGERRAPELRHDRECGLDSRGPVRGDSRGGDALLTDWSESPFIRPSGTVRATMLFVEFADAQSQGIPTRALRSSLVRQAVPWVDEVSYGRARLEVAGHHTWLRLPKPSTAYWPPGGGFHAEEYLRDVIAAANPTVDFSHAEIVYVVPAPGSEIVLSLAHTEPRVHADRSTLHGYVTLGQDSYRDIAAGWPTHLIQGTAHLFSLPYLDDPTQAGAAGQRWAGAWDPMGEPALLSHPSAWSKRKLGWLEPGRSMICMRQGVVAEELVELARHRGLRAISIRLSARRRYVIEARGRRGFDGALCAEGVLVWLVDGRFGSGAGPMRIQPARPDSHNPARGCRDAGASGALDRAPLLPGGVFKDAEEGVKVAVKRGTRRGYLVRVRKS